MNQLHLTPQFKLKYCYTLALKTLPLHSTPTAAAKSLQSSPTLCDPIDGSPPGSPVPGIFQARVLEWGAIAFSVTPTRTAIIKKIKQSRTWRNWNPHTLLVKMENGAATLGNSLAVSQRRSTELPCDPGNQLLGL